jgi:hypothetical protein
MWTRATATGADLLWRVKSTLSPRHLETLEDGSRLAQIIPTSGTQRQHRTPLTLRVIDYTLDDGRDNPERYRLLTTILDPADAPAPDLALAYAQRWEIENTFDELKTHQRGPRAVLRSKSPPLVLQEIWGRRRPSRPTRPRSSLVRRRTADHPTITVAQLFSPSYHNSITRLWNHAVDSLQRRINPARRLRANPRVVKRKVLKWAAKRKHHQHHPQPSTPPQCTILIH